MKKNEVRKIGSGFTFAELIMISGKMNKVFKRDEELLLKAGLTTEVLTSFEKKSSELQNIPSDLEMETLKMCATDEKNKLAGELKNELKRFTLLAKQVYAGKSRMLNIYTFKSPSKMSDCELSHNSWIVANFTKRNISDFDEVNISVADCDALIANQEVFKYKFIDINEKINERDDATEERWLRANEVYSEMMRISEFGKFVWENVSESKYNDYVIYPSSSNSEDKNTEETETEEDDFGGVPENDYNS